MQEPQADPPTARDPATRPHMVWIALPGQLSDDPEVVAAQIAATLGGLKMAAQITAALDGREADQK
jgi:hypothetical protein